MPAHTGPRDLSRTASSLNSRENLRISMAHLRFKHLTRCLRNRVQVRLFRSGPNRNCIERVLDHLKINRAIAIRYDQPVDSFPGNALSRNRTLLDQTTT
jgi:hypothetical protein